MSNNLGRGKWGGGQGGAWSVSGLARLQLSLLRKLPPDKSAGGGADGSLRRLVGDHIKTNKQNTDNKSPRKRSKKDRAIKKTKFIYSDPPSPAFCNGGGGGTGQQWGEGT